MESLHNKDHFCIKISCYKTEEKQIIKQWYDEAQTNSGSLQPWVIHAVNRVDTYTTNDIHSKWLEKGG